MKLQNINKIAIIGAGAMGNQIAEILSRQGEYTVNLVDINEEFVQKGLQAIDDRMERFFVAKGKISAEDKQKIMKRISGTTSIAEAVKDIDFVLEAVPEMMNLKQDIFKQLDEHTPEGIILASNTSTLNVTEIAAVTSRPDKVIGMHFFNPVAVMKLVEVIKGALTSEETASLVTELTKKLGKEPVVCRDTSYGFLANRAYEALREEALQMVWEKVASPEDVDKALKLGYNLPQGPLELGDLLGSWKRRVEMEEDRIKELGPVKGRIHELIRVMVRAGYPGGPGKKGIYDFWKEVMSRW
jgi:3-hydroxybutyryl-CoA dehydrogenase